MSRDAESALLALKNAWNGAVLAAGEVRALSPAVQALPETTPLGNLDLETYHRIIMAHANAALALRGLIEEIQRKRQSEV